eukprot:9716918-Ditylum_brightwellii.AAC.1
MKEVAQPTLRITNTGCDPVCGHSDMATLPKLNCNTSPLSCPCSFGDTFDYDIVYSADTARRGTNTAFGLLIGQLTSSLNTH